MKTVFVGLSGGVDSAVSAALLKEQGYNVVGAFIKIWQPEFTECTWKEDRIDAMRVCVALGTPFKEIDLSEEYIRAVVANMIEGYKSGITPNPDVLCNRHIKFGPFSDWAKKSGADFIATGHYAQIGETDGKKTLLRGVDTSKDQSYFLYQLTEDDLHHILFPVGHLTKKEVRAKARALALPVAEKHDSQGLCFVGEVTMRDFLSRFIDVQKGPVSDGSGKIIGEHEGAALYTIGQRHGFTLSTTSGKEHYVTQIHIDSNTLVVSETRTDASASGCTILDMHWVNQKPDLLSSFDVQTRYRENPVSAKISEKNGIFEVSFEDPHIAAAGQSLVVYQNDRCLGGGIISAL